MTATTPGARPRRRSGARDVLLILAILAVVISAVGGMLVFRYGALVGLAQDLRATGAEVAAELKELRFEDLDGQAADRIEADLGRLGDQLQPFREVLDSDPLVGIARSLPVLGDQVKGADAVVGAADDLVAAGGIGTTLAHRFREVRARGASDPESSLLSGIVELMATSGDEIDQLDALLASARAQLAAVPAGAVAEIRQARDLLAEPLDDYGTLLFEYRRMDDVLPGILGWGGEERYLVIAQNPAELRPTGGYGGTIGVIVFKDGRLAEQRFFSVYQLDLKPGIPHVDPPPALEAYLLGDGTPWRLADANWSPHFPTSAQQARALYSLESGDDQIDGVIGITTYALDRILEVVGPVEVPGFGVTVKSGDVTMTILEATRTSADGTTDRKAILDALAETVLERLLVLPTEQWVPLFHKLEAIGKERLALAWFEDPKAEALVAGTSWGGEIRQDAGDYLAIVESNMAPTSKYNLAVERSSSLNVDIASDGAATSSLRMDWRNDAGKEGEPYASLRRFSTSQDGLYGAYVRALVPDGANLITANGRAIEPIRGVESVSSEEGRTVFANFLLMPPGEATLTYFWDREAVAELGEDGVWTYRLTIQKQPGAAPEPLSIRIGMPDGAGVVDATDGVVVEDDRATFETTLTEDLVLEVRYTLAEEGTDG